MQITKCDICKKEIKEYNQQTKVAPEGQLSGFTFCPKCSQPVLSFLRKHKLLEKIGKKI